MQDFEEFDKPVTASPKIMLVARYQTPDLRVFETEKQALEHLETPVADFLGKALNLTLNVGARDRTSFIAYVLANRAELRELLDF